MKMRTALVTGASSGLGRELVRQLVRDRGMTVVATARRLDRLEALAGELPPGKVIVVAGDLADASFRAALWQRAEALPGGLDLLVNNAGLGEFAKFELQEAASIRRIIEVNLVALIDLSQQAIVHMRPRRMGQVVQVSSILGFMGMPYSAVYVATKHAVNGLVKSLRYELRGSGVRVWAACPGRTESEFFASAIGPAGPIGPVPGGAPTEKVAHAIVRGLDRNAAFLMPGFIPKATVAAAHWLAAPFDWMMDWRSARYFADEIARARGGDSRQNVTPSPP